MKIKNYCLFASIILLASCSQNLDLENESGNKQISLTSDEYISIAYDNPKTMTPEEAKQIS